MIGKIVALFAVLAFAAVPAGGAQAAKAKAKDIVEKSKLSVESMTENDHIGTYLSAHLKKAKGVLIVPQMLKGAFGIGAEGGSGVLLVRGADGSFSYPAFFTLGSVSIGFQVGGSASEVMLLFMSDKGVKTILGENKIKLGADLGVAAGPVGAGAEAAATLGSADILVYSVSKGAYLGISLEGSVIEPRESLNKEYYGAEVDSKSIVLDRRHSNPHASGLRAALAGVK